MFTCSFHHGTECVSGHNRRTIKNEAHVDPNGFHEVWVDESIDDAYKRIFNDALQEYNNKQKRADRKIKNYLQHVKKNPKLNPVYEFILQVGNEKNHPDKELCYKILKEYYEKFSARNPGLEVIGAYYHDDEIGGCPHIHMDYIPVAQGKKTGLKIKNGLAEALKKLGYETEYVEDLDKDPNPKTGKRYKKMVSGEIKFQNAERSFLEELCKKHGLEIANPKLAPGEYESSKKLRAARNMRIKNESDRRYLDEKEQFLIEREEKFKERIEQEEFVSNEMKSELKKQNITEKSSPKVLFNALKLVIKNSLRLKEKVKGIYWIMTSPLSKVREVVYEAEKSGCKNLEEYFGGLSSPSGVGGKKIREDNLPSRS